MTKKLDEMADCWAENSKKEVWGTNYTTALSHGFKAGWKAHAKKAEELLHEIDNCLVCVAIEDPYKVIESARDIIERNLKAYKKDMEE